MNISNKVAIFWISFYASLILSVALKHGSVWNWYELTWFNATLALRFNEYYREVTIHRPNFATVLSSAFIWGDLIKIFVSQIINSRPLEKYAEK